MALLLDLDETLIREREARDQAALDFLQYFSTTLCFSESDFLTRWHELQEFHFRRFTRNEISFQEHRRERLRALFLPYETTLSEPELDFRFDVYLTRYEKNWSLFDDVRPFLERFKHCKLGIVTNGDSKQQTAKLTRTGILNYFQAVIISDEVGAAKPEPKIFLDACRALEVSADDCTFIGDRIDLDIEGSIAAGMDAIWLNRCGHANTPVPFKTAKSLLEIEFHVPNPAVHRTFVPLALHKSR
jgi:putative hydrolase of the HAD superfamily